MSAPASFDCVVRETSGAYVTSTVRGHRASNTMGAEWAVKRLAEKVFGRPAGKVYEVNKGVKPAVWRAEA